MPHTKRKRRVKNLDFENLPRELHFSVNKMLLSTVLSETILKFIQSESVDVEVRLIKKDEMIRLEYYKESKLDEVIEKHV